MEKFSYKYCTLLNAVSEPRDGFSGPNEPPDLKGGRFEIGFKLPFLPESAGKSAGS